jgi:hypothetical protein
MIDLVLCPFAEINNDAAHSEWHSSVTLVPIYAIVDSYNIILESKIVAQNTKCSRINLSTIDASLIERIN